MPRKAWCWFRLLFGWPVTREPAADDQLNPRFTQVKQEESAEQRGSLRWRLREHPVPDNGKT
jgi:hypothetical protein